MSFTRKVERSAEEVADFLRQQEVAAGAGERHLFLKFL